uniref:CW80Cd404 protein n=1 Tax=Chlamydomonas sp. (strain W80) TaxID=103365 RepID=Q2WF67_CHLSW|nr:CW80Cd404 protein [Chlamydomonas sp. W80]
MSADAEKQSLLATGVPAHAAGDAPKVAPREWRHRWYAILGDCSAPDVVSCLLAWKLPFVAWAWNQNRALGMSFWRELLRFAVIVVGFVVATHVAYCGVMMAMCPEIHDRDGASVDGGPGMMRKLLHMHQHHSHHHDDDSTDDSTDSHDHGMWGEDGPHGIPRECVARVAPAYVAITGVFLALAVYMTLFFARRRTALRERYGIAGTAREDCLLYAFCTPCALAQETRTLIHEQVHDGIWYGALPGVAPPAATVAAPAPQKMAV